MDAATEAAVAALAAEYRRLGTAVSFEVFRVRLEPLFRIVLSSEVVAGRLARVLGQLADDPKAIPTVPMDRQGGARLFPELPPLSVARIAAGPETGTLTGSPRHRLLGCLTGQAVIRRFTHSTFEDPSILNRNAVLTRQPDLMLGPREHVAAAAWTDVTECDGHGLILQLESPLCHTNRWAYSREALRPVALVTADRQLGRIEEALSILREIGSVADARVFEILAEHPAHAVRWEAIRTAFALNCPEWRNLAQKATRDVHPDVRAAATAALAGAD